MATGRRRVLLTVSGVVPPDVEAQVASGRRPRPDYLELAEVFGADVVDHASARRRAGVVGRLLERLLGADALLAWVCFRARRDHDLVLTDGEQVGLPLAALLRLAGRRRPRHAMVVHVLSTRPKVALYRALRLGAGIDVMFVYATAQKRFVHDVLRFPEERVVLTPFTVDARFFQATPLPVAPRPTICAVGRERRDFATLVEAVRDLDVELVVASGSPWSKQPDAASGHPLPPNVTVCTLGFEDLRELYARSSLVVIPLHEVDFQAGITSILEAMAMARAVVCTRTAGQTDAVVEGVNGAYVPPGDAAALRAAIEAALADPAGLERLGAAGRAWIEAEVDVPVYARGLRAAVEAALPDVLPPAEAAGGPGAVAA